MLHTLPFHEATHNQTSQQVPCTSVVRVLCGCQPVQRDTRSYRLLRVSHIFRFCSLRWPIKTQNPFQFVVVSGKFSARPWLCSCVEDTGRLKKYTGGQAFPSSFQQQGTVAVARPNSTARSLVKPKDTLLLVLCLGFTQEFYCDDSSTCQGQRTPIFESRVLVFPVTRLRNGHAINRFFFFFVALSLRCADSPRASTRHEGPLLFECSMARGTSVCLGKEANLHTSTEGSAGSAMPTRRKDSLSASWSSRKTCTFECNAFRQGPFCSPPPALLLHGPQHLVSRTITPNCCHTHSCCGQREGLSDQKRDFAYADDVAGLNELH